MQWIVEGTRTASFRLAVAAAQMIADTQNQPVPVIGHRVIDGQSMVKMVEPKSK